MSPTRAVAPNWAHGNFDRAVLCLRAGARGRRICGDLSYVKQTIADLLQNRIDMSQLVISKSLSKQGATPSVFSALRLALCARSLACVLVVPLCCDRQTMPASKRTSSWQLGCANVMPVRPCRTTRSNARTQNTVVGD